MGAIQDTKNNIAALRAAGVPDSLITGYGGRMDTAEKNAILSKYTEQKRIDEKTKSLPDALKNDPSFQSLSADQKEIVAYNYTVQQANNTQKIQALNQALEQATAQADPYWRQIIRIAQTEVSNGLADIQGDYQSQNENLKRQIQYIQEDLATNKGNLTLDQQAQMASLAADLTDRQKTFELNMGKLGAQKASQLDSLELQYNKNIDDINRNTKYTQEERQSALDKINRDFTVQRGNLIGQAADTGMTFSTKRKIAEQRLAQDNQGLVESTQRQYEQQLAELESNRNYLTAQKAQQTGDINTEFQFSTEQQKQAQDTAQRQIQEQRDKLQRDYAAQIAELETQASRGNTQAQAQMVDLQRKLQSSLSSATLSAEKYLGSENLPTGVTGIGGVTGSLYEDKTKDIAARQQAIYGELTQQSLNF